MLFGILVTYRRPQDLRKSLEAIARQSVTLDHLVVVDNSPSPRGAAICEGTSTGVPVVDYLPASENLGPAGGFGLGMRMVLSIAEDQDWIALFDDDDPPRRDDQLERMLEFAREVHAMDPRTAGVGMFGARLSPRLARPVRPDPSELDGPVQVHSIGNNWTPLYLTAAVRDVGPYDPRIFFGFEELEFGMRLLRAGYRLYADGDAWREMIRSGEVHEKPPSVRVGEPTWRHYYGLRNLLWIQRRHGRWMGAAWTTLAVGILKPLLNLAVRPALAVRHLRQNFSAILSGWRGDLGRTLEPRPAPEGSDALHPEHG